MIKNVASIILMTCMVLAGPACSPLEPEVGGGSMTVSLLSRGTLTAAKVAKFVHLTQLRCILKNDNEVVRDNVFYAQNGYFTIIYRDLKPGDAYCITLYASCSASSMDAFAEQDSIAIESRETTDVALTLHSMIPTPVKPDNGASVAGTDITFEWDSSELSESFMLFVSSDSLFKRQVVLEPDIHANSYTLCCPSGPATLYWKVAGRHSTSRYSVWSEIRYVTIN